MARMRVTTCYLRRQQIEDLRRLSRCTKVPIAEYIRQAVDLALRKHEVEESSDQRGTHPEDS